MEYTKEEKKTIADKNKDILTAEIEQDIKDTQAEIVQMESEAKHFEQTPMFSRDARFNDMKARERRSGIEKRKNFIKKLECILEVRKIA